MKRETKIGLLALVTIAVIVVGYNFLKGKNLFSSTKTLYVVYENVAQLSKSDMVVINGYRVGQVSDIQLNPENVRSLIVALSIEDNLPIPKDAGALIKSDGLLGGKFITLEFDKACDGSDCAEDGDYLRAETEGILESFLGNPEDLKQYTSIAQEAVGPIVDSLGARLDTNSIGRTLHNAELATQNLAALTAKIDLLLARSGANLAETTKSVASITANLERNNLKIERILAHVDSVTANFAGLDLGQTLAGVDQTLVELKQTLSNSSTTIDNLNGLTSSINNGEGTLGKLINEDDVYVRLDRAMTNLDLLLQDFRLNPKRYVNVSVFGKKQENYEVPEGDPANAQLKPDN